jgi:hypothetical protein
MGEKRVTSALTEAAVLQACSTLFGLDPHVCTRLLVTLQPGGAKSAYRRKAKETHPDLFYSQDHAIQQYQASLFRAVLNAYDTLNRFFKEREEGLWRQRTFSAARTAAGPERATHRHATPKKTGNDFYRGPMPFRVLEIGRYLYYSGVISYGSLIEALVWQRKQRPLMGSVAKRWGWLNGETIKRVAASHTVQGRFGERAVRLGLLTYFQVNTILYYQRTLQERLGFYFVQKRLLTEEHLELLASKMMRHNASVVARQMAESRRRNTYR